MMLKPHIFLIVLYQLAFGIYEENNEFANKIRELVDQKAGGDPKFLWKFINDVGIPKGLKKQNDPVPDYCLNISKSVISNNTFSDCTVLQSLNRTVVKLNSWSGFDIFKFSVNLLELKNIELEMTYRSELTYFYFTVFKKCENCLFNFTKNPSLVGIRFWYLSRLEDISVIPVDHRPKLYIRGNSRLKLSNGKDRRKINDLKYMCNPGMCVIQNNEECHFRRSIKSSDEYKNCRHVYQDMHFNSRFQENNPREMNFKMDGCFVFNQTGIQYVRPLLKAFTNCSHQHVFENNKYMCTDQLEQLISHWEKNKVHVISDGTEVKCHQGECRGGFVSENIINRYSGCETFQGDVYISESSGNLSDRIRDLSYAHVINGQLQLVNNTSITKLSLPFLKKIRAKKCPALLIANMNNLKTVIFHGHVEFYCKGDGPKVIIRNSNRLYLHRQMLRQMRKAGAVFEDFDSKTDSYSENFTFYLIGGCFVIVIFVEIIWALRKNLLFPNFFYRLFPMSVNRRPKQKQPKKKKAE